MKLQKIIVSGILEKDGKVFLAKRPKTKTIAPGKYHLPGGHVEFGEEPSTALVREFIEEFHLKISVDKIIRSFSYVINDAHTVGITYLVKADIIPERLWFDATDTEAVVWSSQSDIQNYLADGDHDLITLQYYFAS